MCVRPAFRRSRLRVFVVVTCRATRSIIKVIAFIIDHGPDFPVESGVGFCGVESGIAGSQNVDVVTIDERVDMPI